MSNLFLVSYAIAIVPWALIVHPIHDHYNWKAKRPKKLCDNLILLMKILVIIQAIALCVTFYLVKFD